MNARTPLPVRAARRVHRAILRLAPRDVRRRYARDMIETFHAASADAALPRLRDLEAQLNVAQSKIADMPAAARTLVSDATRPMLSTLQTTVTNTLALPGVADKLRPILESIISKLRAFVS